MSTPELEPRYQLLPSLSPSEFHALKEDIRQRGVLVPIERDAEGVLLDGHHRLRALEELRAEGAGLADPPVIIRAGLTEAEKRSHVRALNLLRRHLSAAQRREVIEAQLAETPACSDRAIAHALSVSPTTVGMVRRRLGGQSSVQNGQLGLRVGRDGRRRQLPVARTIIASNESDAARAVAALEVVPLAVLPDGVVTDAEVRTAVRMVLRENSRGDRIAKLRDPGPLRNLGHGKYAVLYLDPPWRYTGASDPTRTAENHYPTLSHEELLALPVGAIAARSAVLYMWCTPPKLAEAVALIAHWGFSYKTGAVWDKERQGLGSWYRLQHELLLIATRGDVPAPAPQHRPSSVIRSPRGAHSAKPDIVRTQIERAFPGVPRVELFARGPVPGWDVWGFEAQAAEAS